MSIRLKTRDSKTCLSFDGTDDYVNIPHNANQLLTSGFTLSAWIMPRSAGEDGGIESGRIFDKSAGANSDDGFMFIIRASDLSLRFGINSGSKVSAGVKSAVLNKYQHVLVTVDENALVTFYINGVQSGTPGTTGALAGITTTNDLRIGNRSGATDRTFDGLIDEPRIWNRPLTQTEITNLYVNAIVPQSGLVLETLFDEMTGTTAIENVIGNNGTISGATYSTNVKFKPKMAVRHIPYGLSFDGDGDYVASSNIFDGNSFSITFWYYAREYELNNGFIGNDRSTDRGNGLFMYTDNKYRIQLRKADNSAFLIDANGGNIKLNAWTNFTLVFDESTVVAYENGIVIDGLGGAAVGKIRANSEDFYIGRSNYNDTVDRFFNGNISSTRYFNKALTPTEIHNLYYNNIVPTDNLVAEYFNSPADGSGSILTNTAPATIGTNDGTITGASWTEDTGFKERQPATR